MKKLILEFVFIFFLLSAPARAIDCSAAAACLIVADTGEIIYEKNAYEKLPMASTTKIMTALVALESCPLGSTVTVSANAATQEGSSIYLSRGDKIRMEDLLYGLMLSSGNDAAVAVAEHVSGSVEAFCEEMTALAREIGANNTCFKNPSGLYEEGHFTTAHDLAQISAYAVKNQKFREIVSAKEKNCTMNNGDILYFKNHNKLLDMYDGAIGIKTGYTKKCGRCLVSCAERDGIRLVAVTLNDPNDWADHMSMLDYGFSGCKLLTILNRGVSFKTLQTADKQTIGCFSDADISIPTYSLSAAKPEIVIHPFSEISPPLKRGDKIGTAEAVICGKKITEFDLLCDRTVTPTKRSLIYNALRRVFDKTISLFAGKAGSR